MASRRACGVAIFVATVLVGGVVTSLPADARRRARRAAKARPQPAGYAEAKKAFIDGVGFFDGGDYTKAIAKFEESLKHYRNPKVYARIGLCYKWLGNNLKALIHYERFLKNFPASPTRPKERRIRREVELEVRNLLLLVSRLRIIVPAPAGAEVRLNGWLVGRAPLTREVRLNPGTVNVTVMAKGYFPFRRGLKLVSNQSAKLRALLVKIKPKVIRKVIRIRSSPLHKRWWFWTVIGTLVAGGATGLALGLTSKQQTRDLGGLPLYLNNLARW